MKYINLTLAVLFLIFAIVQFNDPDSWIWIAIYLAVSVISGFAIVKKYNIPLLIIGMLLTLGGALYLSPGVLDWFLNHGTEEIFHSMSPDKVFIETARECFGLLIAFFALGHHYLSARKLKNLIK